MRGRRERSRVEELEDQVIGLRVMALRLWQALRDRTQLEDMRETDPAFDAAETIWNAERITIVPCRVALDPKGGNFNWGGWPTQSEMYLGRWPDGGTRNLTRAQVLMMGGQDPDEGRSALPDQEIPF